MTRGRIYEPSPQQQGPPAMGPPPAMGMPTIFGREATQQRASQEARRLDDPQRLQPQTPQALPALELPSTAEEAARQRLEEEASLYSP